MQRIEVIAQAVHILENISEPLHIFITGPETRPTSPLTEDDLDDLCFLARFGAAEANEMIKATRDVRKPPLCPEPSDN